MSKVHYLITENTIILAFDGKTETVDRDSKVGEAVKSAIINNTLEEIPELLNPLPSFGEGVELVNGLIHVNGIAVSSRLAERISQFADEGLPVEPLAKFAEKLASNPSFNSRKQLYDFLEHNGHPLTQDGNFIAYRGVTDDYKDRRTKTFDNSIGSVCEMNRDEVDDNPNNTCSSGLHVACHNYAYNWGERTVLVEIDPQDVVCVPNDYDGTKMRVCKFKVIAECEQKIDDTLYDNDDDYKQEYYADDIPF